MAGVDGYQSVSLQGQTGDLEVGLGEAHSYSAFLNVDLKTNPH
jgi:hypothetical protein